LTDTTTPDAPEAQDVNPPAPEADDDRQDTFPRAYVVELRKEAATYRERARQADDYAKRLHAALVAADGRLADPSDLDFDAAHLDDAEALVGAVNALLASKPHLAARRPRGDVDQGPRTSATTPTLGAMLRASL